MTQDVNVGTGLKDCCLVFLSRHSLYHTKANRCKKSGLLVCCFKYGVTMVAAALLYKVKSWLTGSYVSEFSGRSSLFLGLVVMNCSNSIAIDLMSSVCMTAVGFPFLGPLPPPYSQSSNCLISCRAALRPPLYRAASSS